MMLKNIIDTINFDDLWEAYTKAFGSCDEETKASYLRFIKYLKTIEPVETGGIIFLENINQDEGSPPRWYPFVTRDNVDYDISGTPWKEWLGMGINENTIAKFTSYEIVEHCLSEMLGSWDEDENELLNEFWGVEPT